MKSVMLQLLLAGVPPFLPWHLASVIFTLGTLGAPITSLADPVETNEREITVTAYAGEGTPQMVFVKTDAPAGKSDGRSTVVMRRVEPPLSGDAKSRAWLGVSIDEVPEAVAAQLSTKGRGVLVSNVVTGSPADKAGFQAHDVVLSVNGEPVDGDHMRAVDLIRSRKPGDAASFIVVRNGVETTLTATLGSWADANADHTGFAWKFETAPEAEIKDHVKTRGKFIHRGPAGEWTVKDLGDLKDLADLPDNIKVFVPKGGDRSTQVFVENGSKTIRTRVEDDGSAITVEQKDDGPITVRRTDEDGKESVASYDNEDALRDADEEAFKIFSEAGKGIVIKLDGSAVVDGDFDFDFDFDVDADFDSDAWKEALEQWKSQVNGTLSEAHEAYAKAMEEVHATLQKLKSEGGEGALKLGQLHMLMHPGADGSAGSPKAMAFAAMGKPRQSFELRADGTIEVRVRKGDSELVQLYKNESDLQQRNAELYEKYLELKSIKE